MWERLQGWRQGWSCRTGFPNIWDLMSDNLRWSWCNNNNNKVHNECNAPEPFQNHPPPHPWKKCLLWNWSLVPKRLGTVAVEHRDGKRKRQGGRTLIIQFDLLDPTMPKEANSFLFSPLNYHIPPLSTVSLSAVSVTHVQPQSENIKWKIQERNNS